MSLRALLLRLVLVGFCSAVFPVAAASIQYAGVNLAGAEFGVVGGALPGTYNTHYIYPNQTEVTYFRGKGMNTVRLCFRWERLQQSTNAPFNSTEFNTRFHPFVSQTTAKGVYVIINPHNFARYYPDISDWGPMQSGSVGVIGSASVPNAAFADLWSRIANIYKTNPFVIFGLMNEPNALPASQWVSAANAAITAIRATGATNLILVPGISWTGAHSWISSGNSVAMLGIVDPANNYAYEVHQYMDSNSSGGSTEIVNANIGVERVTAFTQWLKDNNRKGFLGEFAVGNSTIGSDPSMIGDETLTNLLGHIQTNADVWLGWTWWAAGPWWGGYMFTLEGPPDQPTMPILRSFIPMPQPNLRLTTGNKFWYAAQPGFVYQAQSGPGLIGTWTNVGSAVTGNGQMITNSISIGPGGGSGFYRVRVSRAP